MMLSMNDNIRDAPNLPRDIVQVAEACGRQVIDMFFALSGGRMPTDQEADELIQRLCKDSIEFCAQENLSDQAPIPFMQALLRSMNARAQEIALACARPEGTA